MPRRYRFAPILTVLAVAALMALAMPTTAPAQADKPAPAAKPEGQAIPDTPKKDVGVDGRRTPVAIEHGDTDVVGTRMVYHLKELLGRSSLMSLTTKDEKKLVLVIQTQAEFTAARPSAPSTPWPGSIRPRTAPCATTCPRISASWTRPTLEQTVEAVLTKTDKMAATYGYLFQ
jgi:hypothetical protein